LTAAPVAGSPGALGEAAPPPFSLPGGHFAAATAFFLAGAVGLVAVAPTLAAGAYLAPSVTAVAHLFTLGWITTSIMGALYQFLPVALGESIRWERLARVTLWLHACGLAAFVAGLALFTPAAIVAGAALFGAALLLFAANLAATLRRAHARATHTADVTWWALASACAFLVLTVAIGGALAGNLRWGFLGGERLVALATHLHVALVGWVLLVMVGVGHRLLPMFLLSHGADERPGKVAVALLSAGTALLFAQHHAAAPALRWLPASLILAGAAAFLVQARAFYRTRRRKVLDPGMRLAAAGLSVLGAGAALGVFLLATDFSRAPLATAYVLLLVLGISLFVAAHHYKIVPFLVWYHRFGPLAGQRAVPKVSELYSAGGASVAGALLVLGTAVLAVGTGAGLAPLARCGAALFAVGATILAGQMAALARRRPDPRAHPPAPFAGGGRPLPDGASIP
jgi:hypothetical protein